MFKGSLPALVTPFTPDGELDLDTLKMLVEWHVDQGSHGLVPVGTTGESPTLTHDEHRLVIEEVVRSAAGRIPVIAGAGSNSTREGIGLIRHAADVGADAALVVTPYYNKPTQAGVLTHFRLVADATDLPVMLYDIPPRSVVPIEVETLVRAAEHPNIVAVKDAKGDLGAVQWTLARTDLAYYSGEDMLNLPLLAVGGVGVVSVVGHLVGTRLAELVTAVESGDLVKARAVNESLLPVYTGIFRTQGVILVKAALRMLGLPAGPVRPPLVDATPEQLEQLRMDLTAGGVPL